MIAEHIEQTPGIAGGKPRIKGHRITVEDVAVWHERMGRSVEEIASEYGLSLADVYAALAYYFDHREEVEATMRDGEAFVEAFRAETPSKLAQKPERSGTRAEPKSREHRNRATMRARATASL